MPTAREATAEAVVGGTLYVFGGQILVPGPAHVLTNVVEAYDPATNTWDTAIAPIPSPRSHTAAGVLDGRIHLVGGNDNTSGSLALNSAYDPATDTWSADEQMPTGRRTPVAGVVGGTLYVVGGTTAAGESGINEAFQPAAVVDGGRILFYSSGQIDIVDPAGTDRARLSTGGYFEGSPDWSPDGTKIVFNGFRDFAGNQIYVMDADGSNVVRLTGLPG